jgi:putative DNA primase/helicase
MGTGNFVLPTAVIGPTATSVVLQYGSQWTNEYGKGGTLAGWQQEVAAYALGNPVRRYRPPLSARY